MPDGSMTTFAVMVFIAVFLLAQGMIVPVFGESRAMRKRLSERLGEIDREGDDEGITTLMRERYLHNLSPLEKSLEQLPFMESLRKTIEQSGMDSRAYRVVIFSVLLAIGSFTITWMASRMLVVSLVVAVVSAILPYLRIVRARANRLARFEEQLPDAIDVVRRALLAGHPFSSAMKLVAEDMEDPIAREFELTFADINYGNDARRAMLGLLSRVPSVSVMALVTSVLVQRETGGNLAEILGQISTVIRGRFKLQRKVKTMSAEGRMSAWVLAMVPLGLFIVMSVVNPNYLPILLDDPLGQKMVMFAFVWGAIGIYFIRRIIRIDV